MWETIGLIALGLGSLIGMLYLMGSFERTYITPATDKATFNERAKRRRLWFLK